MIFCAAAMRKCDISQTDRRQRKLGRTFRAACRDGCVIPSPHGTEMPLVHFAPVYMEYSFQVGGVIIAAEGKTV